MRRLLFALAFAVPLVACGKSDDGDGTAAGTTMTAEAIATNDVTAIDAVTGEAANMAADVALDANQDAEANASGNVSGNVSGNAAATEARPRRPSEPAASTPAPARPSSAPPPAAQPAPAPEPQANRVE